MFRSLMFLLVCCSFTVLSKAQTPENRKQREVYLPILDGVSFVRGEITVFLTHVKGIDFVVGTPVQVYHRWVYNGETDIVEKEFELVGSGRIERVNDTLVMCYLKLKDKETQVEPGDLIRMETTMMDRGYEGVLAKTALRGVIFSDTHFNYWYTLQDLILNGTKEKEESLLTLMLNDLKASVGGFQNDQSPVYTTTISNGRFAGSTPFEAIAKMNEDDLKSFLLFAYGYDVYIGTRYPLFHAVIGWLATGSSYSSEEIKESLLPLIAKPELFKKSAEKYREVLSDPATADFYLTQAKALSKSGKFSDAIDLAELACAISRLMDQTDGLGFAHLIKGDIFYAYGMMEEALKELDEVLLLTSDGSYPSYKVSALRKKANIFQLQFRLEDATKAIRESGQILDSNREYFDPTYFLGEKKNNLVIHALIEKGRGDYGSAVSMMRQAMKINEERDSYESISENAIYGHFLGEVLNEQGMPNDAIAQLEPAEKIYLRNKNRLEAGRVQNEIAYARYLMGNYPEAIKYINLAFDNLKDIDLNNAGYSKSLAGTVFWEMGMYESAIQNHLQSIDLRRIAGNLNGQADSWKQIGKLYRLSGLKKEAITAYDSSLFLLKKINNHAVLSEVYNEKGEVYLNDEMFTKAISYFDSARLVSKRSTAESLFNLGVAWEGIDVKKAIDYYKESRAISDSVQNKTYLFATNASLARIAYQSRAIGDGDFYLNELEKIAREINTPWYDGQILALRGEASLARMQSDSAIGFFNRAAAKFKEVSISDYLWQHIRMATVQREMGNFSAAEELLKKVENHARENNNQMILGSVYTDLTFLYGHTGDFAKGEITKDSARAVYERSGNYMRLANAYNSAGVFMKSIGNFKESIRLSLMADSIFKQESQWGSRVIVLNNIAVVLYSQGDYHGALSYLARCEELDQSKDLNELNLFHKTNIAECYYYLKEYDSALALYADLFPFAKEVRSERVASGMALIMGKIYLERKDYSKALEYLNYAQDFSVRSGEKNKLIASLIALGDLAIARNENEKGESWFRSAVNQAANSSMISAWEAFYKLGLFYYNQQKFDTSVVYLTKAIDLLEQASENVYGGEDALKLFNNDPKKQDLFSKITFAYYKLGKVKEAWAFANKSNIAGIKELSGSLSERSGDKEIREILEKIAGMQETKKALEKSAEKFTGEAQQAILQKKEILESQYSNFIQDVVTRHPELSTYFSRARVDDFYDYKGSLPDDVAVVLYLTNDETLMIFTLTNEQLSVDNLELNVTRDVDLLVRSVKQRSGAGIAINSLRSETLDDDDSLDDMDFYNISDKLYKVLVGPIENKIKGKKRICIIPSGIFSNMPFQSLGKREANGSFRYLLEDYAIFYNNRMRVFDKAPKSGGVSDIKKSFAAFGVPDRTLRFNTAEVKSIGKIVGADEKYIYTDERATESMAKRSLESKRYVHFATHGVLVYSSAFSESYLKFLPDGDDETNDGRLTIGEIQTMNLKECDLVILSACETGISREAVAGWNISPANAFLERSARAVIASLWKVDDEATSILMNHFYSNLNNNMEMVEALRLAQKKLSSESKFSHPFYWGAFVLYGDWR